jgi:hypothetical protein
MARQQTGLEEKVDVVLGVSMAPTAVHMVLVEGENADGVTVDEDGFEVAAAGSASSPRAPEQVLTAILGTQESAAAAGHQLTSIGVTWTDQAEAAMLRDTLADYRVENVMLVSAFLAAAALAQSVGGALGYARTALLFLEPDSATLALVDSADGSVLGVQRQSLDCAESVTGLTTMLAGVDTWEAAPDGLFVMGSGIGVAAIKHDLEAATTLPVSTPEEPATALARGAALASGHAPLFASSTAAFAYARDPGTGEVDPDAIALAYANIGPLDHDATLGYQALAYSAVADESATFSAAPANPDTGYEGVSADQATGYAVVQDNADGYKAVSAGETVPQRSPFLLVGSAMAAFCVAGVAALVISLAVSIRPTADAQPNPGGNIVFPTKQMPAPSPAPPPPTTPQQVPVVQQAPPAPAPPPVHQTPAPAPAPAAPTPAPDAPAPPPPAPAPAPPAPAPALVVPIPIPVAPPPAMPSTRVPGLPSRAGPSVEKPSPPSTGGGSGSSGNGAGAGGGSHGSTSTGRSDDSSTGSDPDAGSSTGNGSGGSGNSSGSSSHTGSSTGTDNDSSGSNSGGSSGSDSSGSGSSGSSGSSSSGGSGSSSGSSHSGNSSGSSGGSSGSSHSGGFGGFGGSHSGGSGGFGGSHSGSSGSGFSSRN